ncbi:tetratricopeptide repeat protein [Catenuloplanes indicus]|uniref:Tetratricopeptide (TPR) repeat protein n=1 Tax=Catenuloplanes indicus TaxID=137267 RepID=A0AAE3VT52_9ACTN|nr:tetratricopeptide repeat protein [Catenuloplanes indicus]MDQ0363428.1 tetratricopeptide (TPR) repeat protein [Catenuloplanes indicus]
MAGRTGPVRAAVLTIASAVVLTAGAAVLYRPDAPPEIATGAEPPVDAVAVLRERLRLVPGDWRSWAGLAVRYVERARGTGDPGDYARAEESVRRSYALHPDGNADALVADGMLANARHDFAAGRDRATEALALNDHDAGAQAVLADALTQLGPAGTATGAVQRLLDLRPGLSAYTRGSYDLELRGDDAGAADLMTRALTTATAPADIAFCRAQLGDLAFHRGDLAGAAAAYAAGLAADPGSAALRRGQARVLAAQGRTAAALEIWAGLPPEAGNLIEYADLLRALGRPGDARAQLALAEAQHGLFTANGGVDGITGAHLAIALGDPDAAVTAARAEYDRRRHPDVADAYAWALHAAGRDAEALPVAREALAGGARPASYLYHLGVIAHALGDPSWRGHLAEALTRNPAFSPSGAADAGRLLAVPA